MPPSSADYGPCKFEVLFVAATHLDIMPASEAAQAQPRRRGSCRYCEDDWFNLTDRTSPRKSGTSATVGAAELQWLRMPPYSDSRYRRENVVCWTASCPRGTRRLWELAILSLSRPQREHLQPCWVRFQPEELRRPPAVRSRPMAWER